MKDVLGCVSLYRVKSKVMTFFVILVPIMGNTTYGADSISGEIQFPGTDIRITTRLEEGTPQEISKEIADPGIVYVDEKVHREIEPKLPNVNWIPVSIPQQKDGREEKTVGYVTHTDNESAKQLVQVVEDSKLKRMLMASIGASLSAGGIIGGRVIGGETFAFEMLVAAAAGWTVSFSTWYWREGYSTIFNYKTWRLFNPKTWTLENIRETHNLRKEYLATNIRPEKLKDASKTEQIIKLYLLEAAFIGLSTTSPHAVEGIKSLFNGIPMDVVVENFPTFSEMTTLKSFISASVAYTAIVTYDFIILRERDKRIKDNPSRQSIVRIKADLLSMVIGSTVNATMINAAKQNPEPWAVISLWSATIAINTYFIFQGEIHSAINKFRERFLSPAPSRQLACPVLF